ncbi:hypothetical protein Sjap_007399 [Stephania japonica]|uniref:Uncharacterized protein n=1 Tax=Stephania japonica TaxID=461633 RepID=A0AAP0JNF3_9MAGN
MEIFAMADSVKLLGFTNFLLNRHDLSLTTTSAALSVSAAISPTDSVAPPIVRSSSCRTVPRTLARRSRTRKRSAADGGGEDDGLFGDGDDGPFGGSGSGPSGGGRGWNFGDFGGNWEDDEDSSSSSSSSPSYFDPAFDFVYEVISWIALSNCVHFAFKKVVRIVGDGIGDAASREKVPVRYVPVY